ncbi:hypothetical protein F5146DRAFT_937543, partial [Armillaria mellea]
NKQLFVRPCSAIVFLYTLYNAESLIACDMRLTPEYLDGLPSFIFYDNNCQLIHHTWIWGGAYYDKTGLAVETRYAKSHTETN